MNAILDDPEVVVETIAGVLDHESEVEEIENKLQLVDMIETDPLSATVVFTDLVIQKQQELNILEEVEDEEATTPAGHKYEDPPEAVRGQLLRLQMTDSPGKGKKKVRLKCFDGQNGLTGFTPTTGVFIQTPDRH